MRLALALTTLALLTGCAVHPDIAGTEWTRPGVLIQQITLDEVACARQAADAGATPDLIVGGVLDVGRLFVEDRQRRSAFHRCMVDRGYRPVES